MPNKPIYRDLSLPASFFHPSVPTFVPFSFLCFINGKSDAFLGNDIFITPNTIPLHTHYHSVSSSFPDLHHYSILLYLYTTLLFMHMLFQDPVSFRIYEYFISLYYRGIYHCIKIQNIVHIFTSWWILILIPFVDNYD